MRVHGTHRKMQTESQVCLTDKVDAMQQCLRHCSNPHADGNEAVAQLAKHSHRLPVAQFCPVKSNCYVAQEFAEYTCKKLLRCRRDSHADALQQKSADQMSMMYIQTVEAELSKFRYCFTHTPAAHLKAVYQLREQQGGGGRGGG